MSFCDQCVIALKLNHFEQEDILFHLVFSDLMYPCKVRCYTNGCHLNATRIGFPIPRGEARDHENFVFTIPWQ